jgi:gliding motility-associated-like protein
MQHKILVLLFNIFVSSWILACHNSTINSATYVTNPDGSKTFTLNVSIDVGSSDGYSLGFALILKNSISAKPSVSTLSTLSLSRSGYSNLKGYTGSSIGTENSSSYLKNRYQNRTDVITFEASDKSYGFGSTDYNNNVIIFTVSGCVEEIELDADIRTNTTSNTPVTSCLKTFSTGITCPCLAPVKPEINTSSPTCSNTGISTISNFATYSAGTTFNFTPSGPTVGSGGVISGMVVGTNYTVTATTAGCTSLASNSFSILAQLTKTTPTFTQVAQICSGGSFSLPTTSNNNIPGTWSPANNNASTTTYTFTPNADQCANTATMTVTVGPPATPTFTQVAQICSGGSFSLPTTSNNNFTGSWSPAINNTSTITYTFTPNSGQCASTAIMTVTVGPPATPTFTQVAQICSGGSFSLPTTSNNNIPGTWSPANNNTSTTTYTFTPNAGQCANTATMTVTVGPPATPTFTQVAQICSGGTFTLPTTSNNNFTGSWSPAINNTSTTTYTFTPNSGQCASTATMTVTVGPPATPTFTQVAQICSGGAFNLPTTSNNNFEGIWSPAINNTSTTTYTFTPNSGQCAITTNMTVIVGSPTSPTFTQVAQICSGETFTLPTTSNNNFTGSWSPAINNTSTTTYTFTPNSGQCANTYTMTVTIDQPVTPIFTQVAQICSGGSFSLPTTSNNNFTGTWSPAINNTTTTTYTFTPNAGQCASTATITVTVGPPATPTFTQVAQICSGSTFTLPTTSNNNFTGTWSPAINNTSTTNYTFTPNAGQCATTTTMTVSVEPPVTPTFTQVAQTCNGGTFTLPTTSNNNFTGTWSPAINNSSTTTYTFTPNTGQCANTASMTVNIVEPVTPTFSQVGQKCSGESFLLPTTSINGISGTWSPVINNNSTTTYTFIPNSGQCALNQNMTVVVNANPNLKITQPQPECEPNTINLLNPSITAGSTDVGSMIYFYSDPLFTTLISNPAAYNILGTTTVYAKTTNSSNCSDSKPLVITINPKDNITITSNINKLCSNDPLTYLKATPTNGIWSGIGIKPNGAIQPSQLIEGQNEFTYTSAGICPNSKIVVIDIFKKPSLVISRRDTICEGEEIKIQDISTFSKITKCTWDFGDNVYSYDLNETRHKYYSSGFYDVTFIGTDENGCTDTLIEKDFIYVLDKPIANFNFSPSKPTIFNNSIQTTNLSMNATHYRWDFGDESESGLTNPSHKYSNVPNSYFITLKAYNQIPSCLHDTTMQIEVFDEIYCYIPNTFTPNGDELNNEFKPTLSGSVAEENYSLYIYNRWGELLFESHNKNVGWNGAFGNKICMPDTYIWKIEFKDTMNKEKHMKTGHVNLVQ